MYSQIQSQCQFINSSITDNNTKVTVFRSFDLFDVARGLGTDQACKGNTSGTDRKKKQSLLCLLPKYDKNLPKKN